MVLFIGRGVAYHKIDETEFFSIAYYRNDIPLIGRGVVYRKMASTYNFSSTINFVPPPWAIVRPPPMTSRGSC
jgi:hypothetical protein